MRPTMSDIFRWWSRSPSSAERLPEGDGAPPPAPTADASAEPFTSHYERFNIPASLNYPSTTLGPLLDQSALRFGDAPAVIYGELRWSYRELREQVDRLSGGLAMMGVGKGDRVLMTLPNCPEFITTFFAAHKLGAVVVNAGPLMGPDDLAELVRMTQPRVVVALDLQAPILADLPTAPAEMHRLWVSLRDYQTVWKRLGYQVKLWQTRRHTAEQMTLAQLLAQAPARPPTAAPAPDDLALLQPTGGTTGTLKVAELSHANLIANALQMSVWVALRPGQERVLAVLPMFHVYGLSTCLTTPVLNAGAMIPQTRFRVDVVLEGVERERPTVLPLAPAIVEAICDELERSPRPAAIKAMRDMIVISGAAPLTPEMSRRFERITGNRIIQGYGLTEASPVTHANPLRDRREGSIGLPFPDTRVRIADLRDAAADAEPGEPGQLLISGPQVMAGYFQNPEETEKVLSVDDRGRRWLHTADVVRTDDDGFFYVVDRQKNMINRGGLKVWPAKVERILLMHPKVADAAVVGRADPTYTEAVLAIVAADPSLRGREEEQLLGELKALSREHLAPYEVPDRFRFVDALPRTALGKLLKHKLDDGEAKDEALAAGASEREPDESGDPAGEGERPGVQPEGEPEATEAPAERAGNEEAR